MLSLLLSFICQLETLFAFVNNIATEEEYPPDFFPPLVDADDISHFFSTYDLDGLHWALTNIFHRSSRNPQLSSKEKPLPDLLVARGGGDSYTSEYKLRHDLMQAEYLVTVLKDDPTTVEYLKTKVIPIYQAVLQNIPPLDDLEATKGLYAFTQKDYDAGIASIYNKALYMTSADELYPSWRENPNGLLNSQLDWADEQRRWFGESNGGKDEPSSKLSSKGVLVIDNLLNEQTLNIIRKLLLRNTHW
jgi:hypothetical protein